MDFNDLVKYIKSQRCKVKLHKGKKRLEGNAIGLFLDEPKPRILLAIKGRSRKEKVSVLLHEYGHFCQWRDGFSKYLDGICWPHQVLDDWLTGYIELSTRELKMVRNSMLTIEYDAELRSYYLGKELGVKGFNPAYHLREAQSYMAAIKWAFAHRKDWKKKAPYKLFPAKILTHEELFAPLTEKENKILKKGMRV